MSNFWWTFLKLLIEFLSTLRVISLDGFSGLVYCNDLPPINWMSLQDNRKFHSNPHFIVQKLEILLLHQLRRITAIDFPSHPADPANACRCMSFAVCQARQAGNRYQLCIYGMGCTKPENANVSLICALPACAPPASVFTPGCVAGVKLPILQLLFISWSDQTRTTSTCAIA